MDKLQIKVKNTSKNQIPGYGKIGNSGMDVRANLDFPVMLEPGERKLIPTGLFFELPENIEIQVRPRSGLALNKGVTVLNTPGTVDSNYRGEVCIILINLGQEKVEIEPGERIAQLVFSPVLVVGLTEVEEIETETERKDTGFGNSGRF